MLATAVAALVGFLGKIAISRLKMSDKADLKTQYGNVEKVFAILMVVTACCMAFAHGSNDVANAIGPLAAVVSVVESGGVIGAKAVKNHVLDFWSQNLKTNQYQINNV